MDFKYEDYIITIMEKKSSAPSTRRTAQRFTLDSVVEEAAPEEPVNKIRNKNKIVPLIDERSYFATGGNLQFIDLLREKNVSSLIYHGFISSEDGDYSYVSQDMDYVVTNGRTIYTLNKKPIKEPKKASHLDYMEGERSGSEVNESLGRSNAILTNTNNSTIWTTMANEWGLTNQRLVVPNPNVPVEIVRNEAMRIWPEPTEDLRDRDDQRG